jgi:hypothetical protein
MNGKNLSGESCPIDGASFFHHAIQIKTPYIL